MDPQVSAEIAAYVNTCHQTTPSGQGAELRLACFEVGELGTPARRNRRKLWRNFCLNLVPIARGDRTQRHVAFGYEGRVPRMSGGNSSRTPPTEDTPLARAIDTYRCSLSIQLNPFLTASDKPSREDMDARGAPEPDMSTYLGVNMTPVLGPLFWGMFSRAAANTFRLTSEKGHSFLWCKSRFSAHELWTELIARCHRLTGITVLQAYHYFPSKDRPAVQYIVCRSDCELSRRATLDSVLGFLYAFFGPSFLRPCCSGPQLLLGEFPPSPPSAT